ncbi:replicative DNA helicase [Xanthomonas arboricola]|uniref:DNA 5'-3' helicase n=1 Tax=Xanthomonas arboricola TaxID=56448 RepID=A0AAU9I6T4_9XANT|nr:replicative DNA helicase [Xanthomonas arboricola]CAE6837332.1 Replicative DNA helicase [Xanthomonas arboricola]CAE6837353.1 Replicative DNA helicase [Xanthomonas arboricola]
MIYDRDMELYDDAARCQLLEPPHSREAEESALAALMLDNSRLVDVQDWLRAEHFFLPVHRAAYAAILALAEKDRPFDGVTVCEWLDAQGNPQSAQAGVVALNIASNAYTTANVIAHAEIIVQRANLRQLVEIGQQLMEAGMNPKGQSAEAIASKVGADLSLIAPLRAVGLKPYKVALKKLATDFEMRKSGERQIGLPTPWKGVNKAIGALLPGQVYVLAARSNQGKSTLGFQLARFSGLRGTRTGLFSMEMNDSDVAARDVSAIGNVPFDWVMGLADKSDDEDIHWGNFTAGIKTLIGANIVIDDDPQLSAAAIVARSKRAHRQDPLGLLVIDHLHEMALPGKQGEVIERGQALRDLKALAKNLGIPVVVLAQLNRGAAEGRRPTVADIRGSGGIEEVADVILFIHRPDVYNPTDRPGLVEVIVGKGRNVKTGTVVSLRNRFEYQRAEDWEGADPVAELDEPPVQQGFGGAPSKWRPSNSGHRVPERG